MSSAAEEVIGEASTLSYFPSTYKKGVSLISWLILKRSPDDGENDGARSAYTGKGKRRAIFHAAGQLSLLPARKKKEIPQYIGVKKLRSSPFPPSLSSTVFMVMAENYNAQTSFSSSSFLHLSCQRYFFCVSAALLSLSPSPQEEEEKLLR